MVPSALSFTLLALVVCLCSAQTPRCNIGTFLKGKKCKPCPAGTYQNKKGATSCIPCPAGFFNKFKGAPGADICQPCRPGTFSTVKGATSRAVCKKCPTAKSSPEGADRCISCPAGSFISKCAQAFETLIDANNVCLLCDFEYCETGRAELKCRKCSSGSFSAKKNSLECNFCPENTTSEEGSSKCKRCPPGQGNNDFNGICTPCDFFSFNDGSLDFCNSCPDGSRGNKKIGATKCVPCPAGTRGELGSCKKCKSGENTMVTGALFCAPDNTPCASNFFRNSRGLCVRCARSQLYNKSKNRCDPCGKNEFSKGGVDTKCTKCSAGEEAIDFRMVNEQDSRGRRCVCKLGLARMPDGKCKKCPAGWFRNGAFDRGDETDGDSCRECFAGTFSARAGSAECSPCPKGTAQPLRGQTKCVKCPRGTISTGATCTDPATGCPKDQKRVNSGRDFFCESKEAEEPNRPPCTTFQRFNPKTNECVPCRFGSSSKGGKSRTCEKCDGIFWTSGAGCQCVSGYSEARELVGGKCRKCLPGTFGTNGVTGCEPCPAGTFRDKRTGTGDECNFCVPGTFSNVGAAKCTRCPNGTNSYGFGFASCVKPGSLK